MTKRDVKALNKFKGFDKTKRADFTGNKNFNNTRKKRNFAENSKFNTKASLRKKAAGTSAEVENANSVGDDGDYVKPENRVDRLRGRNAVNEALSAGRPIEKLWLNKNSTFDIGLQRLISKAKAAGVVIVETDTKALERLGGRNHQGIVAQVAVKDYLDFDELLKKGTSDEQIVESPTDEISAEVSADTQKQSSRQPLVIMLDQINDPHNLGAVLRVADCLQATAVVVSKHRACTLDATVARTSAGAIENVDCCKVTNIGQAIEKLKENGYWTIALDMNGENLYSSTALRKLVNDKLALVIGNEGAGISPSVRAKCDLVLSIPMYGQVNSLNASVALAIVSYEIERLRNFAQ